MNLLITGGAGYIGSITAAKLIEMGHDVTIIDNLEMGHKSTIEQLKDFGDFTFLKIDLRNKSELKSALQDKKFDAAIHFAAYIEVGRSVKEPEVFLENNFEGTKNLLEVLYEIGVNKFVFSSTAAVYGDPDNVPIKETDMLKPINPYGQSKVDVEMLLEQYADQGKIDSIRLRYFNPAGAYKSLGEKHKNESHLIPLILKAAKNPDKELKIFGEDYDTKDGTPLRDYIHVEDLADAHINALKYLETTNGTDMFNVGTGKGYTVKEVFEMAKQITGKDIPYEITDRREGDSPELVADSTKINEILGWEAKYDLEDIIKSAWEFEKKQD